MKYVTEYFQQLKVHKGTELSVKYVYVASDDPNVLKECQDKYPDFTFIGNSRCPDKIPLS